MEPSKRELNLIPIGITYFFLFSISCLVHHYQRIFLLPELGGSVALEMAKAILLGAVVGLLLVFVSYLLSKYTKAYRELAKEFDKVLGELNFEAVFFLAVFSALGEEFFFRGLVQGYLGIVPATLIFGLLHIGPSKKYLPWTYFALVAGLLFGLLYEWTENLIAPVTAHFVVNFLNLLFLRRQNGQEDYSEDLGS